MRFIIHISSNQPTTEQGPIGTAFNTIKCRPPSRFRELGHVIANWNSMVMSNIPLIKTRQVLSSTTALMQLNTLETENYR